MSSAFKRGKVSFIPELNGTTDEKGEYGRASSTVSILGATPSPFLSEAPLKPLAVPL